VVEPLKVAEDLFFAINTQGTPLDETETLLIKARRKPVAIGARAIVRSGAGHAYWSAFTQKNQQEVVRLAGELNRITGNSGESLGLYSAVYYLTEQGKHSRFLFLGMVATISEKLRNNDDGWFYKFTMARRAVKAFLIEHKSLIGIVLQNLNKPGRIPKMRDMFNFMVEQANDGEELTPQSVITHLGLSARVYDVTVIPRSVEFSDDSKSAIFYREAIKREHLPRLQWVTRYHKICVVRPHNQAS
jgi:hypothetical protein